MKRLSIPSTSRVSDAKNVSQIGYTDHYILLDSWNRDSKSTIGTGVYIFNIGSTPGAGVTVPTGGDISNVTEIQISPFSAGAPSTGDEYPNSSVAPYYPDRIYLERNYIPWPPEFVQYPYGSRIALEIAESGTGGVSMRAGGRANFLLHLDTYWLHYAINIMRVTPVADLYRFPKPITTFDTVTLKFTCPDAQTMFGNDPFLVTPKINGSGFLEFQYDYNAWWDIGTYFRAVITGFESKSTKLNDYLRGNYKLIIVRNSALREETRCHLEPSVYVLGEGIGNAGDTIVSTTPVYIKVAAWRMLLPMRIRTIDAK